MSVVVEPSRPADIAALLSDAYRLTERETEVVGLVVRGHTNAEIARALWLSPYTVADHVKNVFEKTGVLSRGELTSRLFFDHYLPRLWAAGASPRRQRGEVRAGRGGDQARTSGRTRTIITTLCTLWTAMLTSALR